MYGFPMICEIPVYDVSSRPKRKIDPPGPTVEAIWSEREINNDRFLRSLIEDLNSNKT